MKNFISKHLKALRGRLCGTVGRLLGHPLIVRVFIIVVGGTLLWFVKLGLIGILSMIGISISPI